MTQKPLVRSSSEQLLGGVCVGLADHLGYEVKWVRAVMAVLVLLGGAGAVLYVWLWITVPTEAGEKTRLMRDALVSRNPRVPAEELTEKRRVPIFELALGACLLIAGLAIVLVQLGAHIRLDVVLPGLAVIAGVGLTWWQIADRGHPERHQLPRILGALTLVAIGVLMFFVTAREPNVFTVVAAAIAVLAGVALAISPLLLRVNRELIAERARRERETERAEIAAHLHDSVLQTLAAIQQRSEPGSDVARLARGQERELREWLFRAADGADPPTRESLGVELRAHAIELERDYAVRFEIVTVGTEAVAAPEPIVASAREAMLNAARHAGGDVTVYIEVTTAQFSVDVTDRGPGLNLGAVPEGRMGVRESIIGRMKRAGGSARLVPGPAGTGTSVRLTLPRETEPEATEGQGDGERSRSGD